MQKCRPKARRARLFLAKRVEAKVALLAEAACIPLGSLHSVLQSLWKKRLIKTARAGSAQNRPSTKSYE